jgi:hypothetical protein
MADSKMGNVVLQWALENQSRHGEGISRAAAEARTRPFRLRVKAQGQTLMLVTLHAETSDHAIRYAEARWPSAAVDVA